MTSHYLGYSRHTDWIAAIDRTQPVNAISIVNTEWIGSGLAKNTQLIVLSQAQGDTVHLLRLITDQYQTMDGREPLDSKIKLHEKRAESAWDILQTWLRENNLITRRALLALHKDLRLLDGHADGLMEFSKDLGYWIFADRIDPSFLEPYVPAAASTVVHAV